MEGADASTMRLGLTVRSRLAGVLFLTAGNMEKSHGGSRKCLDGVRMGTVDGQG